MQNVYLSIRQYILMDNYSEKDCLWWVTNRNRLHAVRKYTYTQCALSLMAFVYLFILFLLTAFSSLFLFHSFYSISKITTINGIAFFSPHIPTSFLGMCIYITYRYLWVHYLMYCLYPSHFTLLFFTSTTHPIHECILNSNLNSSLFFFVVLFEYVCLR